MRRHWFSLSLLILVSLSFAQEYNHSKNLDDRISYRKQQDSIQNEFDKFILKNKCFYIKGTVVDKQDGFTQISGFTNVMGSSDELEELDGLVRDANIVIYPYDKNLKVEGSLIIGKEIALIGYVYKNRTLVENKYGIEEDVYLYSPADKPITDKIIKYLLLLTSLEEKIQHTINLDEDLTYRKKYLNTKETE